MGTWRRRQPARVLREYRPHGHGPQFVRPPPRVIAARAAPQHSFNRAAGAARRTCTRRNAEAGRRSRTQPVPGAAREISRADDARPAPRHSFSPDAGHATHCRGCPPCCWAGKGRSYETRPGPAHRRGRRGHPLSGCRSCGGNLSGRSSYGRSRPGPADEESGDDGRPNRSIHAHLTTPLCHRTRPPMTMAGGRPTPGRPQRPERRR